MFKFGIYVAVLVSLIELTLALSDESKSIIESVFVSAGEKCVKEHPLSEEDIAAFKEKKFPEGKNAACYTTCVLTNIGFVDENGALSSDSFLEKVKEVSDNEQVQITLQKFLDTCVKDAEIKIEDCEGVDKVFDCFVEHLNKHESK